MPLADKIDGPTEERREDDSRKDTRNEQVANRRLGNNAVNNERRTGRDEDSLPSLRARG